MRFITLICLVILQAIGYVPFVSATYELPESQNHQQQLPYCDDDHDDQTQQIERNAG